MKARVQIAAVLVSGMFPAGCTTSETARTDSLPPAEQVIDDDFTGEKPQRVAGVLGVAVEDGDSGMLIGANYEYRLKQGIGVGGLIDYSGGELDATVLAAAVWFRPEEQIRLLVASGFQNRHGDNDFLLRLGGSYVFALENNLSLDPGIYFDFVDGDLKFILAVGFGVNF